MNMGGYGMPFYNDPNQMAYGGMTGYQKGGSSQQRVLTQEELKSRKPKDVKVGKREGTDWVDVGDGVYGRGTISGREWTGGGGGGGGGKWTGTQEEYLDAICNRMKNGDLKGLTLDQVIKDARAVVDTPEFRARLAPCVTVEENLEYIREEEPPKPPEEECECTYPDGTTERMPKDPVTGKCPPCEKEVPEEEEYTYEEPMVEQDGYAPWWLQDTVNTMGAFGDMASINKYMPWAAQVDLEEPRPTFLDPTRELAAQSEQANIAAQASGAFAGNAQQMGARLANIQGQGAAQAANTLSNINNQNVNIANQFEGQQVGIRNQEQLMNQQIANDLYDKNVIANQQFDNAKRQAAQNLRQQYNTAVTNRWKTDAMNQLYPDYAVDPSAGGQMYFNPTPKTPNPIKDEQSDIEYVRSLEEAGLSQGVIERMVSARMRGSGGGGGYEGPNSDIAAQMYGNMQRGGYIGYLKNGGYVYADTIFPFIM